jgi:hypothetical protein
MMAVRSPHKKKKAAKEFKEMSEGVGGPSGVIRAGKVLTKPFSLSFGKPNLAGRARATSTVVRGELMGKRAVIVPRRPSKIDEIARNKVNRVLSPSRLLTKEQAARVAKRESAFNRVNRQPGLVKKHQQTAKQFQRELEDKGIDMGKKRSQVFRPKKAKTPRK